MEASFLSKRGVRISHLFFFLFFTDDILLFTEARSSQLRPIMKFLKDFEEVSSLKVNVEESKVMASKMVPRPKLDRLAMIPSISFTSHMGRYLGFPLI